MAAAVQCRCPWSCPAPDWSAREEHAFSLLLHTRVEEADINSGATVAYPRFTDAVADTGASSFAASARIAAASPRTRRHGQQHTNQQQQQQQHQQQQQQQQQPVQEGAAFSAESEEDRSSSSSCCYNSPKAGASAADAPKGTDCEALLACAAFDPVRFEEFNKQVDADMARRAAQQDYDSDLEQEAEEARKASGGDRDALRELREAERKLQQISSQEAQAKQAAWAEQDEWMNAYRKASSEQQELHQQYAAACCDDVDSGSQGDDEQAAEDQEQAQHVAQQQQPLIIISSSRGHTRLLQLTGRLQGQGGRTRRSCCGRSTRQQGGNVSGQQQQQQHWQAASDWAVSGRGAAHSAAVHSACVSGSVTPCHHL
ncbi:hypothetical protein COO60DRAFT_846982 [Scenedesmus sp. NREL 46B-D3]|nr:hypothetical protein COO60DRAFT_846982 [Scenedesmus sp. NREL 46B-D3]